MKNYGIPNYDITTTPATPDPGFWKFYAKSDGFYQLDDAGTETKMVSSFVVNTLDYIPKSDGTGLINSLIFENTGKIGVGTTTPGGRFTVKGTGTGYNTLFLLQDSAGDTPLLIFDNSETHWNSGSGYETVKHTSGRWDFPNVVTVGGPTNTGIERFQIKGQTTDATTFAIEIQDSSASVNFYVRNDGAVNSRLGYWLNGNRVLQGDAANITNLFLGYYNFNSTPSNTGVGVYAIGYGAGQSNSGNSAILIGADAGNTNSGSYVVGLGWQSLQNNTGGSVYAIGLQSAYNNTGANVLSLGNYAARNNTYSNAAFIGTSSTGGGVGYLDIYIGAGVNRTNETIHYVNLRQGTAAAGETDKDMSTAPFNIIGAVGTGTGLGGDIVFQVAPAGLTGSTQNVLVTAMRIVNTNQVWINSTDPGAQLSVYTSASPLFRGAIIGNATASSGTGVFGIGNQGVAGYTGSAAYSIGVYGNASSLPYTGYGGQFIGGIVAIEGRSSTSDANSYIFSLLDSTSTQKVVVLGNGNVGIATSTPSEKLHIIGSIRMVDGNQAAGKVLTSDANGVATWTTPAGGGVTGSGTLNYISKWTPSGAALGNSLIFDDGTNVGIGTITPSAKFHLVGDTGMWIASPTGGYGKIQIVPYSPGQLYSSIVDADLTELRMGGAFGTNAGKWRLYKGPNASASFTVNRATTTTGVTFEVVGAGNTLASYTAQFYNSSADLNFYVRDDGAVNSRKGYWILDNKMFHLGATTAFSDANYFIGYASGFNHASGSYYNVGIGYGTLSSIVGASSQNIAIGYIALQLATTATQNIAIGYGAMAGITTVGGQNIGIGLSALGNGTGGSQNVAIGMQAAQYTTGDSNTAIGWRALYQNTSGTANSIFGLGSMGGNTGSATTGSYNSVFGMFSFTNHTAGDMNTALGYQTGFNNLIGTDNVFLGARAGFYETGSNKLFIDNQIRTDEATSRTQAMVYGVFNASVASQILVFNANVGIGIIAPTAKLHVVVSGINPAIRLGNGTYTVEIRPNGASTMTEIVTDNIGFQIHSTDGYFRLNRTAGSGAALIYTNGTATGLAFSGATAGTEHMRINSVGNVGIGTSAPSASTLLDLSSTTGALLLPRMTTAQRTALTAVNGMMVYDTDLGKFQGYEAGSWVNLV